MASRGDLSAKAVAAVNALSAASGRPICLSTYVPMSTWWKVCVASSVPARARSFSITSGR